MNDNDDFDDYQTPEGGEQQQSLKLEEEEDSPEQMRPVFGMSVVVAKSNVKYIDTDEDDQE